MSHLVITTKEHQKLLLIKKWSKVGWGLSIALAMSTMYFIGLARGTTKDIEALNELNDKINETAHLQVGAANAIVNATENQERSADLLITWGQYLKNRDEALARNQGYKK